jgi:hypothetical protein
MSASSSSTRRFSWTTFYLDAPARAVDRRIRKSLKRMHFGPDGRKWQRIVRWVGESGRDGLFGASMPLELAASYRGRLRLHTKDKVSAPAVSQILAFECQW